MQRYEKYKDSEIDWLGDIPEHWESKKMKYLFLDISRKNMPNETLLSVTQNQGVVPRDWVENRMVMPTGNLESFKYIEKGDFCISLRSFEGGVEYCFHSGIVSPAYTVLKASFDHCDGYFKYLFKSQIFIDELQLSIVGIREGKNISYELLKYDFLPLPLLHEQEAIANFLDDKCEKIDAAVGLKEQQIEKLKELRQITIHNAVTKGLPRHAEPVKASPKMKDSGIDWIGEIPEHWDVKRIKFLTKIFRGKFTHRPRNDERLYNGAYPFFQTGDVATAGKFLSNYKQSLNEKGLVVSTLFPKGTIVITIAANIGDISILDIDACFPDSIVGFAPFAKIKRDFLYYCLVSMREQFIGSSIKNTQMNLNVERIGSNLIPFPPLAEQQAIVTYLEEQTSKIDKAIAQKREQIVKLKEYKESLINEVVTGKVKVTA